MGEQEFDSRDVKQAKKFARAFDRHDLVSYELRYGCAPSPLGNIKHMVLSGLHVATAVLYRHAQNRFAEHIADDTTEADKISLADLEDKAREILIHAGVSVEQTREQGEI